MRILLFKLEHSVGPRHRSIFSWAVIEQLPKAESECIRLAYWHGVTVCPCVLFPLFPSTPASADLRIKVLRCEAKVFLSQG